MANNPYVNKVQKADGTTIIDISDTTATAADVLNSKYFYTAAGQKVQGTATGSGGSVTQDQYGFIVLPPTGGGGGGSTGLVYETGTWEPEEDVYKYNIQFSDTHTELPIWVQIMDVTGTYSDTTYSNYGMCIVDWSKVLGYPIYASTTSIRYGSVVVYYRGTSTTSITSSTTAYMFYPSSNTGSSNDSYFRFWVTESGFKAYTNNANNYWRTGRTYKWIAVWAPTT